MKIEKLTAEIARELLRYDPETGKLFWRERDRKWFVSVNAVDKFNGRFAGKEAFTNNTGRALSTTLLRKTFSAHRVIWLMETGSWPENEIDHINHDPLDNRWVNLREATRSENMKNQSLRKTSTSGTIGVHFAKDRGLWKATIMGTSKREFLGHYKEKPMAIKARKQAEVKYGYHENHGKKVAQ